MKIKDALGLCQAIGIIQGTYERSVLNKDQKLEELEKNLIEIIDIHLPIRTLQVACMEIIEFLKSLPHGGEAFHALILEKIDKIEKAIKRASGEMEWKEEDIFKDIKESFKHLSGEQIAAVFNTISSKKIEYIGNGNWLEIEDVKKEKKDGDI